MMTKEWYTKIINFMTPWAGVLVLGRGHISHIMKMHYFSKSLFSAPRHRKDKLMTKEKTTKIVNFMIPLDRGSCIIKVLSILRRENCPIN